MDYLQYFPLYLALLQVHKLVLNLIINGLPSIPRILMKIIGMGGIKVLNLIINGLPSIQ